MKKIFVLSLFLLASITFSQSNDVKKDIFGKIEIFSNSVSIVNLKKRKLSYQDFIDKSLFVPVYRYFYNTSSLDENQGNYVIVYDDTIYYYKNRKVSMYLRPAFPGILNLGAEAKRKAVFIYLLNNDNFDDLLFKTYDNYSEVDGKKNKTIEEIIEYRYSSLKKFNEFESIILFQLKLNANDIKKSIKANYRLYERYCPSDTLLVVNSFISEIKNATITLTDQQSEILRGKILDKILNANKDFVSFGNLYEVKMYGIDILDVLLKVITKEDYLSYLKYMDTYYPLNKDGKSRWMYGFDILVKEGVIDNNLDSFGTYVKEVLKNYGCTPDP